MDPDAPRELEERMTILGLKGAVAVMIAIPIVLIMYGVIWKIAGPQRAVHFNWGEIGNRLDIWRGRAARRAAVWAADPEERVATRWMWILKTLPTRSGGLSIEVVDFSGLKAYSPPYLTHKFLAKKGGVVAPWPWGVPIDTTRQLELRGYERKVYERLKRLAQKRDLICLNGPYVGLGPLRWLCDNVNTDQLRRLSPCIILAFGPGILNNPMVTAVIQQPAGNHRRPQYVSLPRELRTSLDMSLVTGAFQYVREVAYDDQVWDSVGLGDHWQRYYRARLDLELRKSRGWATFESEMEALSRERIVSSPILRARASLELGHHYWFHRNEADQASRHLQAALRGETDSDAYVGEEASVRTLAILFSAVIIRELGYDQTAEHMLRLAVDSEAATERDQSEVRFELANTLRRSLARYDLALIEASEVRKRVESNPGLYYKRSELAILTGDILRSLAITGTNESQHQRAKWLVDAVVEYQHAFLELQSRNANSVFLGRSAGDAISVMAATALMGKAKARLELYVLERDRMHRADARRELEQCAQLLGLVPLPRVFGSSVATRIWTSQFRAMSTLVSAMPYARRVYPRAYSEFLLTLARLCEIEEHGLGVADDILERTYQVYTAAGRHRMEICYAGFRISKGARQAIWRDRLRQALKLQAMPLGVVQLASSLGHDSLQSYPDSQISTWASVV